VGTTGRRDRTAAQRVMLHIPPTTLRTSLFGGRAWTGRALAPAHSRSENRTMRQKARTRAAGCAHATWIWKHTLHPFFFNGFGLSSVQPHSPHGPGPRSLDSQAAHRDAHTSADCKQRVKRIRL
jgi:hypothetical protein